MRSKNPNLDDAIAKHAIATDALVNDDFVSFFVERGKSLMRLVGDAMGKNLDDGETTFRNALEAANLQVESDEYDDEDEEEFVLQTAA